MMSPRSRFSHFLKDYFDEVPSKEKKDARTESRRQVSTALTQDSPGLLSRVFNQFPLEYKTKTPFNTNVIAQYVSLYNDILMQGIFNEDESKDGVTIVPDDNTKNKIHHLLKKMIILGCQEILDDRGELRPEIIEVLELHHLMEKWNRPTKEKLFLSDIPLHVLCSYCTQIVLGAVIERWNALYLNDFLLKTNFDATNPAKLTKYLQDAVMKDTGKFSAFFRDQIKEYSNFLFYQKPFSERCAVALEKVPAEILTKIINQDLQIFKPIESPDKKVEHFINAFYQSFRNMRVTFWVNVMDFCRKNNLSHTWVICSSLLVVLIDPAIRLHSSELIVYKECIAEYEKKVEMDLKIPAKKSPTEKEKKSDVKTMVMEKKLAVFTPVSLEFSKWLRARDNTAVIDNMIYHVVSFKLTSIQKEIKELELYKFKHHYMQQTIHQLLSFFEKKSVLNPQLTKFIQSYQVAAKWIDKQQRNYIVEEDKSKPSPLRRASSASINIPDKKAAQLTRRMTVGMSTRSL